MDHAAGGLKAQHALIALPRLKKHGAHLFPQRFHRRGLDIPKEIEHKGPRALPVIPSPFFVPRLTGLLLRLLVLLEAGIVEHCTFHGEEKIIKAIIQALNLNGPFRCSSTIANGKPSHGGQQHQAYHQKGEAFSQKQPIFHQEFCHRRLLV